MAFLTICPRCGEHHLEVFRSHEYCANCNYGKCFVNAKVIQAKAESKGGWQKQVIQVNSDAKLLKTKTVKESRGA